MYSRTFTYVCIISLASSSTYNSYMHTGDVILHARKSGMEQRSRIECKENAKADELFVIFNISHFNISFNEIPLRFSIELNSCLVKLKRGGYELLPNYCRSVSLTHWNIPSLSLNVCHPSWNDKEYVLASSRLRYIFPFLRYYSRLIFSTLDKACEMSIERLDRMHFEKEKKIYIRTHPFQMYISLSASDQYFSHFTSEFIDPRRNAF